MVSLVSGDKLPHLRGNIDDRFLRNKSRQLRLHPRKAHVSLDANRRRLPESKVSRFRNRWFKRQRYQARTNSR